MSNYTPITDFSAKDSLSSGDPNKVIKGSEQDAELDAIAVAITSKADDDAVVHDTGTETVAGNKTLTGTNTHSGPNTFSGTVTMSASPINEAMSTVASATTPNIWTNTGNIINYTGTTTATGFAAAPQAGARRTLVCSGAAPFTADANLLIDGVSSGSTFTCAAGDRVHVVAVTTSQFRVTIARYDGYLAAKPTLVQRVAATPYSTYSTTSTTIPWDNSIPQNTEGAEFITASITPKKTGNTLVITARAHNIGGNGGLVATMALFQDSTADALAAATNTVSSSSSTCSINLSHEMTAGTTSSTTFKIRLGPNINTLAVNGHGTARTYGGISVLTLVIEEYEL